MTTKKTTVKKTSAKKAVVKKTSVKKSVVKKGVEKKATNKSKKSVTDQMLAIRHDPKTEDIMPGEWYSSFSVMKKYAIDNKIPFIAVWTNGDACAHCVHLEKLFLDTGLREWFKKSGYVMWFGCSKDTDAEDKYHGKGFNWCYCNGKISLYPFVRLHWKSADGKTVDEVMTGNTLRANKDGASGVKAIKLNISKAFAGYIPAEKKLKIRTNPEWDAGQVADFKQKIKDNGGYCPCQEPSEDSKCMCKNMRDKNTPGLCICELYEKYYD